MARFSITEFDSAMQRRRMLEQEARSEERRQREALQAGLAQAQAAAARQGVAVEAPAAGEAGAIITARDGFTWLCGSRKRRAQLSEAQIAAGLRHRALADAARGSRVTADYDRFGEGGGIARTAMAGMEAQGRAGRRLAAAERLARAEAALAATHPSIALVTRRVVEDGMTLAAVGAEQRRPEPVVLEVLRMGLDKLAEQYGFRSSGR